MKHIFERFGLAHLKDQLHNAGMDVRAGMMVALRQGILSGRSWREYYIGYDKDNLHMVHFYQGQLSRFEHIQKAEAFLPSLTQPHQKAGAFNATSAIEDSLEVCAICQYRGPRSTLPSFCVPTEDYLALLT